MPPAYVAVMATGRSDYPNQINNVLCFPGIFRGALNCRASRINEEMKLAAAHAIAGIITENELHPEYIVPSVFDKRVGEAVAAKSKKPPMLRTLPDAKKLRVARSFNIVSSLSQLFVRNKLNPEYKVWEVQRLYSRAKVAFEM